MIFLPGLKDTKTEHSQVLPKKQAPTQSESTSLLQDATVMQTLLSELHTQSLPLKDLTELPEFFQLTDSLLSTLKKDPSHTKLEITFNSNSKPLMEKVPMPGLISTFPQDWLEPKTEKFTELSVMLDTTLSALLLMMLTEVLPIAITLSTSNPKILSVLHYLFSK